MLKELGRRARVDLHLHTTRSDGAFSPDEVLARCARSGLDLVSLTDHDLATHVRPGVHEIGDRRITVLAGAEISGRHEGREYHLLVYFPGEVPDAFREFCRQQCRRRATRYQAAVARLELKGIPAPDPAALNGDRALTRLHLAQALVELGEATHLGDAFARYLGDSHGNVPSLGLSLVDAIRIARECGGLTSWAHPSAADAEAHLETLVAAGLHGLEALRPTLRAKDRNRLKRLAKRHGVFLTGGSDWHGWHDQKVGLFHLSPVDLGDFADALAA